MFAILRTKRIRAEHVNQAFMHNLRVDEHHTKHVDKSRTKLNTVLFDAVGFENHFGGFSKILEEETKKRGIQVGKNNNVKMLEFLLTASPEFFEKASPEEQLKWEKAQLDFVKEEFGENLIFVVTHNDEKTKHLHVCILPAVRKVHKYKNQKGEFFKEKHTLSPNDFNPEFLTRLQDRYALHNKQFGLRRGIKGSKAVHKDLKQFYREVNEALRKDYSQNVAKLISKEFENLTSWHKKSFSLEEIINVLKPILTEQASKLKKIKTLINYKKREEVQQVNEIIKEKEKVKNLRYEYMQAIKIKSDLLEENNNLKKINAEIIQKYAPKHNSTFLKKDDDKKNYKI